MVPFASRWRLGRAPCADKDLKSVGKARAGSSPAVRTMIRAAVSAYFAGIAPPRHRLFTAGVCDGAVLPPVDPCEYLSFSAGIRRASALALTLFGAAACSTSSNVDVMLFADPGKYEYHTCEQILKAGNAVAARELKLRELIQKAEQSAGGALVEHAWPIAANIAPWSRSLAVIDTVSRRKNCLTPPTWRSSTAIQ